MKCQNELRHEIMRMFTSHKIVAKKYSDMGCGGGKFTALIAKFIGAEEVWVHVGNFPQLLSLQASTFAI
jgi:hypothetical protein